MSRSGRKRGSGGNPAAPFPCSRRLRRAVERGTTGAKEKNERLGRGAKKRFSHSFEMRGLDSTRACLERRLDGPLEARIVHAPLLVVTAEVRVWWFEIFADRPDAGKDDVRTRTTARIGNEDVLTDATCDSRRASYRLKVLAMRENPDRAPGAS